MCVVLFSVYEWPIMSSPTDYLINSIRASKHLHNVNNNETVKYPCGVCSFEVKHNDKSILCSSCNLWVHIKCNGISVDEYR